MHFYGEVSMKNARGRTEIQVNLASRVNLNSANPAKFVFVVTDANGKEIYRERGRDKEPKASQYKIGGQIFRYWEGSNVIAFPGEPDFPLNLRFQYDGPENYQQVVILNKK